MTRTGERQQPVKRSTGKNTNNLFYLLIAVLAVGGIGALTYLSSRQNAPPASPIDTTLPPIKSDGYLLGSASAPLEVTEFADFECPACGNFATITEPDVRTRLINTGLIRLRFIDFPLSMHRNTWEASRAAACADEQGKFWEMHDLIFQTQDQWNGIATDNPNKFLKQLARQLRLNTDAFDRCVDTKKTQAKIQAHLKIAEQRHVQQTPSFIIGGNIIAGVPRGGFDEFKKDVDAAIAAARTSASGPADSTKSAPKK
jgi:protein-disulfide isomerase